MQHHTFSSMLGHSRHLFRHCYHLLRCHRHRRIWHPPPNTLTLFTQLLGWNDTTVCGANDTCRAVWTQADDQDKSKCSRSISAVTIPSPRTCESCVVLQPNPLSSFASWVEATMRKTTNKHTYTEAHTHTHMHVHKHTPSNGELLNLQCHVSCTYLHLMILRLLQVTFMHYVNHIFI